MADWRVRVFRPTGLVDRQSYCLYINTIPLYGFMDICSCYMWGTECMGTSFFDILQLLSLFPEYYYFQPPLKGTDNFLIQERELICGTYLNPLLLIKRGEALSICPYFRSELEVLVYHFLTHHLLNLLYPIYSFIYHILAYKYH